jgi:FkbM family methyltransferase
MVHIHVKPDDKLSYLLISTAEWIYIGYRILLRIIMGKDKRNEYLESNHVSLGDFLLVERPIKAHGIKAIPRKHTADFEILFKEREIPLQSHLIMNKGETFVDIGANVGYYTLKAATTYGNSVKVISIEAHPYNYKALCRNIACNRSTDIIAINKAVLDKKGIATLYGHITDSNRLLTDDFSILGNYGKKSYLQVESDTIDNILRENNIKNVDVIKMDIEGSEVLALKGATETLKKLRKIIVEIHGDNNMEEVKSVLIENGFDIQTLDIVELWHYYFVIGNKNYCQHNKIV